MGQSVRFSLHARIGILASLGFALSMAFNACSEVKFENAPSSGGPNNGLCLPGSTASGCVQPPPPVLVNYDDTFTIPTASSKADVLLVLDDSGSMKADLTKLALKLDGLVQILDNGGIDWQMCYLTTDDVGTGVARNWAIPGTTTKILTPATPNKASVFFNSISAIDDNGTGTEQGILAIRRALNQSQNANCFRNGASLSVVLISDEDERSCGGRCSDWITSENPTGTQYRGTSPDFGRDYRNQYRSLITAEDDPQDLVNFIVNTKFPGKTFVAHSIVIKPGDTACYDAQDSKAPAFFGVLYSRLQALTGGILGDICADSYADQLAAMGNRTQETINSVTLRCAPVATPTVTNAGGGSVSFSMAGNKVVFAAPLSAGSQIRVRYTCAE